MNLGQVTRMAQEMRATMARVQAELAEATVVASVGGGAVRVVMSGHQQLREVHIDPDRVDPAETELLEDLVFAAVTDALAQSKRLAEEKMAAVSGGIGLPGLLGLGGR